MACGAERVMASSSPSVAVSTLRQTSCGTCRFCAVESTVAVRLRSRRLRKEYEGTAVLGEGVNVGRRRRPGVRGVLWWTLRRAREMALSFFFPSCRGPMDQRGSRRSAISGIIPCSSDTWLSTRERAPARSPCTDVSSASQPYASRNILGKFH